MQRYDLLAHNSHGLNNNKTSIHIADKTNLGSVLYCKGQFSDMRKQLKMDKEELDNLEILIQIMKKQGIKPVIYAKRELNIEQTDELCRIYKMIKSHPMS